MQLAEIKPLTPLTHGSVLLVGVKSSNLDEELRTHPRVIMWDSQQEHWSNKDIPDNVQAVIVTRFISHAAFSKIHSEAVKRRITMFNPQGTGMIVRQVRELLSLTVQRDKKEETIVPTFNKLQPLHEFIDFSKSNIENAKSLMTHARLMNIETTEASLAQMVSNQRKKQHQTAVPKSIQKKEDVSVEILDNLIAGLKDVRAFLIETVAENAELRARIVKFKKMLDGE